MLFISFAYLFALILIFYIIYKLKNKTKSLPKLILTKFGLVFYSGSKHKMFVGDVKLMQIENCVYLKKSDKMIVVKNVGNAFITKGYFYFKAMGQVEVLFNCKNYYRLFNFSIKSYNFNLNNLKEQALIQLANNLFNINKCVLVKRYIKVVESILKVKADGKMVEIKQNRYLLPYTITYKVKNTLKVIRVNQNMLKHVETKTM